MNNLDKATVISIVALCISIANFLYNRYKIQKFIEFQEKDIKYKERKDKEDFILKFKDDINSLRIDLIDLNSNQKRITHETKDQYLYQINDKYNKDMLIKYIGGKKYKDFLDLGICVDEALDKILYKQDFALIKKSLWEIKFFFQSI